MTAIRELLDLPETRGQLTRRRLREGIARASERVPQPRVPRLHVRRPSAELLEDATLVAGLAAIAAGCGWIFPPAAPIVGGAFLVWLALRTARAAADEPQLREPTQVVEQYVFGDPEED